MSNKIIKNQNPKKTFFSKVGLITLGIGLVIGLLIGYLTTYTINSYERKSSQDSLFVTEIRAGGYKFINPLLECGNFNPSSSRINITLKKKINEYIEKATSEGKVKHISFYYRDLNNGPWIGINEKHDYTPASLLKLPLLIAVLKKVENDTTILSSKINYNSRIDAVHTQNIGHDKMLKIGNSYTIEQLIEYMIVYSDNDAKNLLFNYIGGDLLTEMVMDMGINLTNRELSNDFISVKDYSSFFRILFNASYLSITMSEKALDILSRTQFNDGLRAKLPKDILVANKFGERGFKNSKIKQLHDCGIIYIPDNPYLLCIMTQGEDFNVLKSTIADISEITYDILRKK